MMRDHMDMDIFSSCGSWKPSSWILPGAQTQDLARAYRGWAGPDSLQPTGASRPSHLASVLYGIDSHLV